MIANSPNSSAGPIVSQNLEFAHARRNICATDAASGGPFLVLSRYGWQQDSSLKIVCKVFHDDDNERVKLFYAN